MAASIGFNADNQFTVGGTALDYGRNYIINGGFDYWNYATSQTTSGYGSDDRWINSNFGSTKAHSQIASTDTERVLFNSSKFSRTVVTSVAGISNLVFKQQKIENVSKLAGRTITISFLAKADSSKNIAVEVSQIFGTGGTPSTSITGIGSQLVALTSTWQKKYITITVPSIVGKTLGTDGVHTSQTSLYFWFDAGSDYNTRTASLGQQSGTFDIAEVKLEEGSVATPWTPYEGEFGGEVQACQRYLPVISENTSFSGYCISTTQAYIAYTFPTARIAPTGFVISSQTGTFWNTSGGAVTATGLTSGGTYSKHGAQLFPTCAAGLVAGQGTTYKLNVPILFTGCEL